MCEYLYLLYIILYITLHSSTFFINVHFTYCSIVPVYTCLAECSSSPSSICSGLPSDNAYQSIGFVLHISLVAWLRLLYIYTMHILTLVVSFTYSIPRFHWPHVMTELLQVTVDRRDGQATVMFRDDLYNQHLLTAFMNHASRWRHVLADVRHYAFGYRHHDTAPDSWDDACDSSAAFLDHRKLWASVMLELLPLPSPLNTAFLHLHHSNSLLRRRRRTLAPLPLRSDLGRKLTSRHVRRNLLTAFNLSS